MKIPERLADLLARNQEFDGVVKTAISRFEPWIKNSQLTFFPEYTDHGLDHLECVLATASSLIRDQAWAVFTSADAAVTILSVLLHDCAMHLTEDGFAALLRAPWRDRTIGDMNDRPWHIIWDEFLGEASRFDGRKLNSLFGDTNPTRRPSLVPGEMTKRDRLLIGEFLRRHHPRLAQEIVAFGVPGPSDAAQLTIADLSTTHILSLAGIVARSHGTPLRGFLPVIESRCGRGAHRNFQSVHSTFLMALLRVADYLQVQSERAPEQVLLVKQLDSPVSRREWRAHSTILDIRQTMEDPEALHIEARPVDVETFFRIDEWMSGIQSELDESWAVIGEVYGRYHELAPLGLILRRIHSNIEDIAAISKTLDYIPRRAAFRAADADLLKLLIGPLYGDNPAIGMRELIQNAVDAVRELNVLVNDRGIARPASPHAPGTGDVVASIEKDAEGQNWVSVSDSGLGMTADVISNYFLTAGASFRRSDDWRKSFETADGRSKVLRAGRFGIGALAAFLLGNELHVTTRHIDSSVGIEFKATLESEFVELRKFERLVGTSIRIPVSDYVAERLSRADDSTAGRVRAEKMYENEIRSDDDESELLDEGSAPPENSTSQPRALRYLDQQREIDWDWYCFVSPSLERIVHGKRIEQRYELPDDLTSDPSWRRIDHADYDGVYWSYDDAPSLACNGIIVPSCHEKAWCDKWGLTRPNLQVRDPNGSFPLNLQRSELQTRDFPFSEELGIDVARSFCAFALSKLPCNVASMASALDAMRELEPPHISWAGHPTTGWFFSRDGASFLLPGLFLKAGCRALLIARVGAMSPDDRPVLAMPLDPALGYMVTRDDGTLGWLDGWIREITALPSGAWHSVYVDGQWESASSILGELKRSGTRVLLTSNALQRYQTGKTAKKVWRSAKMVEWESNGWVLTRLGNCGNPIFPFKAFAADTAPVRDTETVSECYFDDLTQNQSRKRVADLWLDIFGRALIPFDPDERRKHLERAYGLLEPYMSAFTETA